ncbi:MAG: ADP-L-glycero-D-manno-heptose-6-epimerase, partial [uncultured Ramlibacter sp.]
DTVCGHRRGRFHRQQHRQGAERPRHRRHRCRRRPDAGRQVPQPGRPEDRRLRGRCLLLRRVRRGAVRRCGSRLPPRCL